MGRVVSAGRLAALLVIASAGAVLTVVQVAADRARDRLVAVVEPGVRRCRDCGCTDERACVWPVPVQPNVGPMAWQACHWVAADLCSACERRYV